MKVVAASQANAIVKDSQAKSSQKKQKMQEKKIKKTGPQRISQVESLIQKERYIYVYTYLYSCAVAVRTVPDIFRPLPLPFSLCVA